MLVKSARKKLERGEKPSREEQAAVRRKERAEADATRREICSAIPKATWLEWGNLTHAQLKAQCVAHGFPGNDKTISVPAVASWLHEFLAKADPRAASSDFKGRLLQAKAERAETELQQLRGKLVHRSEVADFLAFVGAEYRRASKILLQRFGPAAAEVLEKVLDDIEQSVNQQNEEAA